jgi:hypothetical protein
MKENADSFCGSPDVREDATVFIAAAPAGTNRPITDY